MTPVFVHVSIEETAVRAIQEQTNEAVPRGNARAIGTAKKARQWGVELSRALNIGNRISFLKQNGSPVVREPELRLVPLGLARVLAQVRLARSADSTGLSTLASAFKPDADLAFLGNLRPAVLSTAP